MSVKHLGDVRRACVRDWRNATIEYDTLEVHILIDEIRAARKGSGWTQRFLAEKVSCSAQAVKRLEKGVGSVATLVAVMDALDFRLTGLGQGTSFGDQLRGRREKRGWSLAHTSRKTGLAVTTIANLEAGGGSVASLLRLLDKLAPKVRRRAPERAYWGPGDKQDRDSRFTPHDFLEAIYESFGEIDLDPCGHKLSPVRARQRFLLEDGDDGLTDDWSGRLVFMNPPFSEQQKWLKRAHEQWKLGNAETIVCLVPTRTDSEWFQNVLSKDANVCLLQGRLRFTDPRGIAQPTPFSTMLVVLGTTEEQRARFASLVQGIWID